MRRRAAFIYLLSSVLGLCLILVFLLFSGFTQGERMAMHALRHLEAKYVFNTDGPDRFDCSGLILHCGEREGLGPIPHEAKKIYLMGLGVARWQLLPGDIVCFDTVRDSDPSDHVGIYLGGNRFVHASSSKHKVVVSELEGFYLEKYSGARRIANPYI